MSDAFFAQMGERVLIYAGMAWVMLAIMAGLAASELKKRSFWAWVFLSLLGGPIAWVVLYRLPIYVPPDLRTPCPNCGKTISKDAKVCRYCNQLVSQEAKDRATEFGKQAAAMVFTAKHLFGRARKSADQAAVTARKAAVAAEKAAAAARRPPANGQTKPPPPTA
jgi:predicted nucleic acid-binding Zn ribbon protein